jgi:hypothetical protein
MKKWLALSLAIMALASSSAYLVQAVQLGPDYRSNDEISYYEGLRLTAACQTLRPWERVGFLEDQYLAGERLWKYYVSQYVLAPAVLINDDPTRPMVLVNFRDPNKRIQPPTGIHYELLKECGGGVWLYRVRVDR